jgi:hypothetical protein
MFNFLKRKLKKTNKNVEYKPFGYRANESKSSVFDSDPILIATALALSQATENASAASYDRNTSENNVSDVGSMPSYKEVESFASNHDSSPSTDYSSSSSSDYSSPSTDYSSSSSSDYSSSSSSSDF